MRVARDHYRDRRTGSAGPARQRAVPKRWARRPIHPGAADPLVGPPVQEPPPQAVVLDRWEHDTSFPPEPAVDFLRSTIRAHPGEVTLLTIGPLTNVALLFAADPAIPSLLDSLVSMGGSYGTGSEEVEWNMHCDPHAAAQVFGTSTVGEPDLIHRAIGLNVTTRVRMPVDELLHRCETPALRPVADMAQSWFGDRSEVVFHDPLAAATIFEHDLCSSQPARSSWTAHRDRLRARPCGGRSRTADIRSRST